MTVSVPGSLAAKGWLLGRDGTAMEKSFSFKTFPQCMAFMQAAAFAAESLNHHPEWTQVYNRLHIVLTTHDTGGLSERDWRLAEAIETILKDGFA